MKYINTQKYTIAVKKMLPHSISLYMEKNISNEIKWELNRCCLYFYRCSTDSQWCKQGVSKERTPILQLKLLIFKLLLQICIHYWKLHFQPFLYDTKNSSKGITVCQSQTIKKWQVKTTFVRAQMHLLHQQN